MFFSVPANYVAAAIDLHPSFFDKASFDVGPGQVHSDHIFVDRLVAPEAKIGHPKLDFQIEVDDLARPATGIALQDGLWLAVARTGKIRRVPLTQVPFRDQNAKVKEDLFQPSVELADIVKTFFFRNYSRA